MYALGRTTGSDPSGGGAPGFANDRGRRDSDRNSPNFCIGRSRFLRGKTSYIPRGA